MFNENTLNTFARPDKVSVKSLTAYIEKMCYVGTPHETPGPERSADQKRFLAEIAWIEARAHELRSAKVFCELAFMCIAYADHFLRTHIEGEDKKPARSEAARMNKLAVDYATSDECDRYRLNYARSLQFVSAPGANEEILSHLDEIRDPSLKNDVHELRTRINRKLGSLDENARIDFTKLKFDLRELSEERTNCRTLIRQFKKSKESGKLSDVLNYLYSVAIVDNLLEHLWNPAGQWRGDAPSDIAAFNHEVGIIRSKLDAILRLNYQSHGRIVPANPALLFLSETDYKNFEKVFGKSNCEFDPQTLLSEQWSKYVERKRLEAIQNAQRREEFKKKCEEEANIAPSWPAYELDPSLSLQENLNKMVNQSTARILANLEAKVEKKNGE